MRIKVNGCSKSFVFSDEWQKVKSMPEDPPNSVCIMKVTEASQCMVLFYQIDINDIMPFDKTNDVINGIHNAMDKRQGLIEVEASKENCQNIYSIIKSSLEDNTIQYCLTLHFEYDKKYFNATGFFSECGMTGVRESVIFEAAKKDGKIGKKNEGWCFDPYDKNFKKGLLMNLSENKYFDDKFPLHPLSETRRFIKEFLEQLK